MLQEIQAEERMGSLFQVLSKKGPHKADGPSKKKAKGFPC